MGAMTSIFGVMPSRKRSDPPEEAAAAADDDHKNANVGERPSKKRKVNSPVPPPKKLSYAEAMQRNVDTIHRGIHPDAIQVFGGAATKAGQRATCIACDKRIEKGSARWGMKYAGRPLPIPVIPMHRPEPRVVLWCHPGGCGLNYVRYSDLPKIPAARTCHACQDSPDNDMKNRPIRLLCGGPPSDKVPVRHHAFHISCWRKAILSPGEELAKTLDVSPLVIGEKTLTQRRKIGNEAGKALTWKDLTRAEQAQVQREFEKLV